MSILVNKDTKVIVQGFTGGEGTFHAEQCMAYGTDIVGGVTPGKGGQTHLGKPVFNTVKEAIEATGATVSMVFVPPAFVGDAVMEAASAGIELAVIITEGAPVRDMQAAKACATKSGMMTIGPNCPGIITADECKIGIMPGNIFKKEMLGLSLNQVHLLMRVQTKLLMKVMELQQLLVLVETRLLVLATNNFFKCSKMTQRLKQL